MSRSRVDVYYDYRSPYAYLAVERVYALAARHNAELAWKPIRLPELSSYRERPLNSSYPKKMAYLRADLQRWADNIGVPLTFPRGMQPQSGSVAGVVVGKQHPLDTDAALRGALVAQARGVFDAYHRAVFRSLWGEGQNLAQPSVWQALLQEIGRDSASFHEATEAPVVHEQLRALTQEADERGVFGVPTFFVGDAMFWGNDRLEFVEQALTSWEVSHARVQ
jgi:2-hydroxychromene-2-carboxylate isomerase